jgi:hypothetical protein
MNLIDGTEAPFHRASRGENSVVDGMAGSTVISLPQKRLERLDRLIAALGAASMRRENAACHRADASGWSYRRP